MGDMEWVPTLYDSIATAFDTDASGTYCVATWRDPDTGERIMPGVSAYADTREDAVRMLIEMVPDLLAVLTE